MSLRRSEILPWWILAAVSVPLALLAVARWLWALMQHAPILYGEGAVANASILARDRLEYAAQSGADAPIFVAANYPPLYFQLAGLGDPFVVGRAISIAAMLFVAIAIALRPRQVRSLAVVVAATWLCSVPVAVWGAALKPDLLALGLTVGSVIALERRRPLVAGALVALAIWTKPTEALPAIALGAYLVFQAPRSLPRYVGGGVVAAIAAMALTHLPDDSLQRHVVSWNALPWSFEQLVLLVILGVVVFGASALAFVVLRGATGPVNAYVLGALGVVLLGGREGATLNYLLDLTAAVSLGIAGAPRLQASTFYPLAAATQAVLALALLDPLGVLPGRSLTTGAWSPAGRVEVVHATLGRLLVEDAGLLVADGRAPSVDDLFLWSRLQERGDFAEGKRLIDAVRDARFDAIVSETDLARLDAAPLYERQRWHPSLASAVLDRYRFEHEALGLFIYRPR